LSAASKIPGYKVLNYRTERKIRALKRTG